MPIQTYRTHDLIHRPYAVSFVIPKLAMTNSSLATFPAVLLSQKIRKRRSKYQEESLWFFRKIICLEDAQWHRCYFLCSVNFRSFDTRNPKSCSQRNHTEAPVCSLVYEKHDYIIHEANKTKINAYGRLQGNWRTNSVQTKASHKCKLFYQKLKSDQVLFACWLALYSLFAFQGVTIVSYQAREIKAKHSWYKETHLNSPCHLWLSRCSKINIMNLLFLNSLKTKREKGNIFIAQSLSKLA